MLEEGNHCQLTIVSVALEDVGEIECRAFNKAGTATSRSQLSLQGENGGSKMRVVTRMVVGYNGDNGDGGDGAGLSTRRKQLLV